jgi:lysophospholipase L1-like esterase
MNYSRNPRLLAGFRLIDDDASPTLETIMLKPVSAALAAALLLSSAHAAQTSWYAAPQPAWGAGFALPMNVPASVAGHTVRETLRLSAGGARLRVVLSNRYGRAPVVVGPVHIARTAGPAGASAAIDPATDRALTFAGKHSVTIAPGQDAVSDLLPFKARPLDRLTVSTWFPGAAPLTTFHWGAQQTGFIAAGNVTAARTLAGSATLSGRAFVSAVQVDGDGGTFVALGDSITDGNGSTPDLHRRWPDYLAERLPGVGIANAGISGARLLASGMGVKAAERFGPDVLDQPGVRAVVVFIGINDIGWPGSAFAPGDAPADVARMIEGYRALIAQGRARGIKVIGGTLLPFRGALHGTPFAGHWSPAKEAQRQQVNAWIRDGGEFDAVVDFDAAVRDPDDATRMLPVYDSGDHLHPGDAGYAAMAGAVLRDVPWLGADFGGFTSGTGTSSGRRPEEVPVPSC